jgi:putative transposase
LKSG